jgi:type II secretory pathway component PulK
MTLRAASRTRAAAPRGGYVIFAVLVVVVILSLLAYRFADSMTSEYRAAVRLGDDAQARAAAISGLHYTAAVLADRDTFMNELGGNPYDNPDIFEQFQVAAPDGSGRKAYFSVRAVALNGDGTYSQKFGVTDEGGKLNINALIMLKPDGQLLHDALMKLPNMTEDVADAIVDWVDADEDPRASGAESSYYQSLQNPYKAKNGPLNSLDELLLVKGVTPYLLYGGDTNRNGVQDPGEPDATRGWSDYLTVYGRELNIDSTGTARIYLNGDDLNTTYQQLQQAVGMDMAVYVVASKLMNPSKTQTATAASSSSGGSAGSSSGTTKGGTSGSGGSNSSSRQTVTGSTSDLQPAVEQKLASTGSSGKRIKSVMDLIGTQVTLPRPQGAKQTDPDVVVPSPLNDPAKLNQLLPLLLDKVTAQQAIEMVPRLNVNTAPREVLMGLTDKSGQPLLADTQVESIVTQRAGQAPTDPATATAAWLVTTNVLTPSQFKKVEKYITGATTVYRVQAVGYTDRPGPVARFEAVIDTNRGAPRLLHVRDLSDIENPRGFPPAPPTN